MATIGTLLYTAFKGRFVGKDKFGNKYYVARSEKNAIGKNKRWVVFKGIVEASKVPAEWHGWLHYSTDVLPTQRPPLGFSWLKEHLPNLTGTRNAYKPAGYIGTGRERAPTVADYEAWKPQ
ncbi:MAG TPA: NADH:ubiquinone oxidoreductase subunit NDUFA12 [Rickettsiales bacterium]|nr:NADH:ubiquinone oxidoreductase subunit NDUFA12 [Rickettsiales bacterium]